MTQRSPDGVLNRPALPPRHPPADGGPDAALRPWADGPAHGRLRDGAGATCRICDVRIGQLPVPEDRPIVTTPEAAAQVLVPAFAGADRERCLAALLDTKHRLVELAMVSVGSIDHTFMAPREVFRDALLGNASAVVLAHNHPSGDTDPSDDDERVTRRLVRAGELMGVEVLDHLIVAGSRWVSLARKGVV